MPTSILKSVDGTRQAYISPYKEYVSAGTLNSVLSTSDEGGSFAISSLNDDLIAEFGLQIYDQMMNDPKISKSVNLLKILTLGNGVELLPCVSDNHPKYEEAVQIRDFCSQSLKHMRRPLKFVLKELMDAIKYGHKIGEKTYKVAKVAGFEGNKIVLDRINIKPITSTSFIVDKYFNVLGIAPSNRGYNLTTKAEVFTLPDSNQKSIKVNDVPLRIENISKFIVLTLNGSDNDPRGKSLLRPAFNTWYLKTQVFPEYLRYLLTCAFPLLVGFTPENQDREELVRDSAGNPVLDSNGRQMRVNPVSALRDALLNARNASVVALKGGSKLEEVGGDGGGLAFYKAIEVFDSQIEQAIILQTLATSESRFNTRAASQTHRSVLDELIWDLKDTVGQCVTDYILKDLITLNFGEESLDLMPKVSLGDTERRDFALDAQAVAALYAAGYISEDQKRFLDGMLGLPVRDSNYDQFRNITPNEQLQLSKAVLEQTKLESDVTKLKQDANKIRTDQLKALNELANTGTLDQANVGKINQLVSDILDAIAEDNQFDQENKILKGLTNAQNRIEQVFIPDDAKQGDENRINPEDLVDTNKPVPTPGSEGSVGRPYIKSKGKDVVSLNSVLSSLKDLINFSSAK